MVTINIEKKNLWIFCVVIVLFLSGLALAVLKLTVSLTALTKVPTIDSADFFSHGPADITGMGVIVGALDSRITSLETGGSEGGTAADRKTWETSVVGTSVPVPAADVAKFCGDEDGCEIRIGMINWDGHQLRSLRVFHIFYNEASGEWWRVYYPGVYGGASDLRGVNNNKVRNDIVAAIWNCYFTDTAFINKVEQAPDNDDNFHLLAWTQYNANCYITLVD